MDPVYDVSIKLLVALAIGLLFGIERGWSERDESEGDRIAGIRTFSLLGLLGGASGLLAQDVSFWILASALLGIAALSIAAHVVSVSANDDIGTTTSVAIILAFVLAAWSSYGHGLTAIAVTVVSISLLGYKPAIHSWIRKISPAELFAGIKLLVISVVLLPLLPNQGYGPWQSLNPYWIWWMVVLISGLSFLGYLAIQLVGDRLGTLVTSIAGGLSSSTAVTLSLARFARKAGATRLFFSGALVAGSIMFIRVLIEVWVVNAALLPLLWVPIGTLFGGLLVAAVALWFVSGLREDPRAEMDLESPLQLKTAVQFGVLLAAILVMSNGMQEWFGHEGVYLISLASGLMDVDAIVLSLARMAASDLDGAVAATGIAIAAATNTFVKGLIFAFIVGIRRTWVLILVLLGALIPGLAVTFYAV